MFDRIEGKKFQIVKEKILELINIHFPAIGRITALRELTTWKIGGESVIVSPRSAGELSSVIIFLEGQSIPWLVLGGGSNVLASDSGCDEVVIKLPNDYEKTIREKSGDGWCVEIGGGVQLPSFAQNACSKGVGGLVFAVGIPGTLGGAVFMNAGAYGSSMADVVSRVMAVYPDGQTRVFSNEECGFSYRRSRFQEEKAVITQVNLELKAESPDRLKRESAEILKLRSEKLPLDFPNAGSVFKRPEENIPPGKLIEDCGLKGMSIGGAEVSRRHANFIVNKGNASAKDVYKLIETVRKTVQEKTEILLIPEVRFIGFTGEQ